MMTSPGTAARAEAPDGSHATPMACPRVGRARAQDIDRHVGAKLRERRLMLGLTQQQMAELIGTTYQQAHKFEKGANRIAAGRLHQLAQALGVEVGYFFEGLDADDTSRPEPQRRLMLGLARDFAAMRDRRQQEALCQLARALAGLRAEPGEEAEPSDGRSS